MTACAVLSLLLAAWPAVLFIRNLGAFPRLVRQNESARDVAILIPARDEARNIAAAVKAALANAGAEVVVLDDSSSDETADVVAAIARNEPRLRLLRGLALPTGWCGKNWACAQLSRAATRPLLLFVDADVRLVPDAAASVATWLQRSEAQLASGVPRQELGSPTERLLIPLLHFVLLGFLPLRRMRRSRHPAYATGCGQLVIARAEAYREAGGHSAIRDKIHDGLALPKAFRQASFKTDLFDATEIAVCRMYRGGAESWRGLSKNTHEGLGSPRRIVPITVILLLGQVTPFLLLLAGPWLSAFQLACVATAAVLALLPRLLAVRRFEQPLAIIAAHPLAITALLAIQWMGLVRYLQGRPTEWKARAYGASASDGVAAADAGEHLPQGV